MPRAKKPYSFSCGVCQKPFTAVSNKRQCQRRHETAKEAAQAIPPLDDLALEAEKSKVRGIIATELQKKKRGPARASMLMNSYTFLAIFGSISCLSMKEDGSFVAILLGEQITEILNRCLGEGYPRWSALAKITSTRHVGLTEEGAEHEFKIRLIRQTTTDHHTNPPTISFQSLLLLNFFIVAV